MYQGKYEYSLAKVYISLLGYIFQIIFVSLRNKYLCLEYTTRRGLWQCCVFATVWVGSWGGIAVFALVFAFGAVFAQVILSMYHVLLYGVTYLHVGLFQLHLQRYDTIYCTCTM